MPDTVSVTQADTEASGGDPECEHHFCGWREFDDGCGGETVCEKCGLGALAYTLSLDF